MKKGNVVAEVSVVPLGTGSSSLSEYVAECIRVLEDRKGISYQLTPMGTIIEGHLDDVIDAVRHLHEVPFTRGVVRVLTSLKIDDRRDKKITMAGKVKSVLKSHSAKKTAKS